VLRPWGLRKSAPLTESPALPEMAAARKARRAASGSRKRPLFKVAAGVAGIVALSGVIAYPYTSIVEEPRVADEVTAKAPPQVVAIADMTAIKERVVNPGLETEAVPVMPPMAAKPAAPPVVEPPPRASVRVPVAEPPPAVIRETPVSEAPVVPVVVARAEEPPRAPVDPWQPLRDALTACSRVQGLWDRATCEQRARLASCDGHWGIVALCPAGRTEYGQ